MVTVDEDYITDVSFKQVDETVTTMYPLLETPIRERYLKAGERTDYEHEGRRRKIFGRFLGQCDTFAGGKSLRTVLVY